MEDDEDRLFRVLDKLEGVRKSGAGYKARCPAHHDPNPSLAVSMKAGTILLHCHAGCSYDDVVLAGEIDANDLFPPTDRKVSSNGASRKIVATYPYYDEAGALLYEVVRYEPKGFSQRRPDGSAGWVWSLGDTRRVLYNLPQLLEPINKDRWVFVVEGEKDVETLKERGFVATTNVGGAGKRIQEYTDTLAGRRVALLPDNDKAGHQHANALLRALSMVASEVRLVELPGLPEKGDVTDWFAAGHTPDELRAIVEKPPSPESQVPEAVVIRTSEVTPEAVEWLWFGRLAQGKITLLEGDPGLGKSTLTIEIAARLSCGLALPDGRTQDPIGVLFMSGEDGVADTIVPRLLEAGADMERVFVMGGRKGEHGVEGVTIPTDLELIERTLGAYACRLLIVDPLSAYLSDTVSENKNQEVRRALAPLKEMLERTGGAAILLRHLTKAQSATPVYRGAGSIGLAGAARIVMMVADDPDQEGVRVLAAVKENLSVKPPSLAYRVMPGPRNAAVPVIRWEGASTWTAHDLQSPPDDDLGPKVEDAVEWLHSYLRGGVTALTRQMEKDAKAAGISLITLRRARKQAGVVAKKDGAGSWGVALQDDHVDDVTRNADHLDHLGPVTPNHPENFDHLDRLPQNTHNNNTFLHDHVNDHLQGAHDHLASPGKGDQDDQGDQGIREEDPPPW